MTRSIVLAVAIAALIGATSGQKLTLDPDLLARSSPELLERLRADPYNYFRLINREWTTRVCEIFADQLPKLENVQLHGDAHVKQYASMKDAWGLDDFDDSARGPAPVDIVRFLGSLDLVVRHRGWRQSRNALFDRFFDGYRQGLANPDFQPPQPDVIRRTRATASPTREDFLASGDALMEPVDDKSMGAVVAAMETFSQLVRLENPDLTDDYFRVVRAGPVHMGIGSTTTRQVLIRVQGPSTDPVDDVLLEGKVVRDLRGVSCLEKSSSQPTLRVVQGTRQLGRLKHDILVAGPQIALPDPRIPGELIRYWWIKSWDPSYREVNLDDLGSVEDLAAIVYDSGVQLAAGSVHDRSTDHAFRRRQSASISRLETRLRKTAIALVEELLLAWQALRAH